MRRITESSGVTERGTSEWLVGGRIVAAAALLVLALGACSGQVEGQEAGQGQARPSADVRLDSVEVLQVDLRSPVERPDAAGELRTWEQAYMVRLALPAPPAAGPRAEIFVGGERISEYGGWEAGVYFWVYDPARLEALRGRAVSYQFDGGIRQEIGALEFGERQAFRRVAEAELRDRQP